MTKSESQSESILSECRMVDRPPEIANAPSGRFRLEIRSYATRPGCWNYTRGTVVRVADGAVVADVERNYSHFHHSFVRKADSEYLISGRSYMGQTIVCLDTGQEWNDPRWPDGYEGGEFCWAACTLAPDDRTLLVDGCVWAWPYEYRFYDFEDLDRGWPELPIRDADGKEVWLAANDRRPPKLDADGRITCFETSRTFLPLDKSECELDTDERQTFRAQLEDPASWQVELDRRVELQRRGDHMLVVEDWRSRRRQDRDRAEQAEEEAEDAMHYE